MRQANNIKTYHLWSRVALRLGWYLYDLYYSQYKATPFYNKAWREDGR